MTKKVGLALGSGSAKGFAHIGVIQVLEEQGVPIDIISGSSAGAIIGSIYAVGSDMNFLAKFFKHINSREYLDMTRPHKGGLVKGERIKELLRLLTHDKTFEQTKIPFFCMATNIETGELVILNTGKLYQSVRASLSVPGVFVPVNLNGKLLVDGGVLERVPCIPLREAGADVVIGVDVGYRGQISRLETLSMRNILDNVVSMMQWEITKLRTEEADIMLCPQVGFVRGFSTERIDDCIAEGRRVTEEAMPQILEALKKHDIPLQERA